MIFSGMFSTALHSGSLLRSVIAGAGIVTTILTVGYGLQTIQKIFFGSRPEYLENVKEAPLTITLPLITLILVTLLLGLFPSAIIDSISLVISSIFSS
jgi:NADH:ubiquinone oxidoreductase subunit 5 (subunit L)/multisubunit Na+/H+ antiporter MnhA subunit